jgi:hypothetical protein
MLMILYLIYFYILHSPYLSFAEGEPYFLARVKLLNWQDAVVV